jgi:hypothetical protein
MFPFVLQWETLDKPTGAADNLCALPSCGNAVAMQGILQEDPAILDRVYLSDDMTDLLVLVRAPIECYRCKGAHHKWQCTTTPSMEEQKGERESRKWGPVPMCVFDPSQALKRSVCVVRSGLCQSRYRDPCRVVHVDAGYAHRHVRPYPNGPGEPS